VHTTDHVDTVTGELNTPTAALEAWMAIPRSRPAPVGALEESTWSTGSAASMNDVDADARDQDYSWAEIGDLLGLTRAAAWHRYGRPGQQGNTRPVQD
jgi:hypothetical protein